MGYADTARAFVRAEQSDRAGAAPTPEALAADRLPLSEWAESTRRLLTPQTVAANHALHVHGEADALRHILAAIDGKKWVDVLVTPLEALDMLAERSRALLAAIGEAGPTA